MGRYTNRALHIRIVRETCPHINYPQRVQALEKIVNVLVSVISVHLDKMKEKNIYITLRERTLRRQSSFSEPPLVVFER